MNKKRVAMDCIALFWILSIAWFLFFVWEVIGVFVPLWAYAIYALLCGFLLHQVLKKSEYPGRKIVFGFFFGCFLASLTWQSIFFSSRRVFLSHLYAVRPDMTVAQVENIMGHYHAFDNWKTPVGKGADGQMILLQGNGISYRHADVNDGCFNADVGTVIFRKNRVESVHFSPD